jgi:hypothetical protein
VYCPGNTIGSIFLNMNRSVLVTVYAWARPAAQVEKRMEDRIVEVDFQSQYLTKKNDRSNTMKGKFRKKEHVLQNETKIERVFKGLAHGRIARLQ